MRDIYECGGCGLKHPSVECGGIWYCPNKACRVSGNGAFRSTLPSYREVSGGEKHTVDLREWALAALAASHEDPGVAAAIDVSAAKLLLEYRDEPCPVPEAPAGQGGASDG